MTPITNHVALAISRLVPRMRTGEKYKRGVAAKIQPLQDAEDLIWAVLRVLTNIELAEGVILDALGAIVGAGRDGLSDALYRVRIRVQVLVNRSNGRIEELLQIFRVGVNNPAISLEIIQGNASMVATILGTYVEGLAEVIFPSLRKAKAGGVRLSMVYDASDLDPFLWASGNTEVDDEAEGFGDTADAGVGGALAGVLAS